MQQMINNFKQVDAKEWKLKVQVELAGLDYNEVLVTDTAEGIQIKPVYHAGDRKPDLSQPMSGTKDWKIIGEYFPNQSQDESYLYGLFIRDEHLGFVEKIPAHLDLFYTFKQPFKALEKIDFAAVKNLQYLNLDPIGHLAKTGNWYNSETEDFKKANQVMAQTNFEKSIEVDAALYQNAGANHVQQIALAVAHGVEYLEQLGPEVAEKMYFKTAVGGNYFFEIAKLRALKKLWALVLTAYQLEIETPVLAETSSRNKSLLDVYNNLIRSGLEAASAVQGKADFVHVLSYDHLSNEDVFSEELASKQQLLLQKEAYFDQFSDPVSGAYFIENTCELMVKNALEMFKNIESNHGFLACLKDGTIQNMITKSAEKEQAAFDRGELVLIGVNQFRNPNDHIEVVPSEVSNELTLVEPILPKRLSEKIETSNQ